MLLRNGWHGCYVVDMWLKCGGNMASIQYNYFKNQNMIKSQIIEISSWTLKHLDSLTLLKDDMKKYPQTPIKVDGEGH